VPYIPPPQVFDSIFSPQASQDLATTLSIIREKYTRFYPTTCIYRMIDFLPTAIATHGETYLTGQVGKQRIDALYGEPVPVDADGNFVQPHGNPLAGLVSPDKAMKYKPDVVNFPFVYVREADSDDLTVAAASTRRNITMTVPTCIADDFGVTISQGDEVEIVEQMQIDPGSYWKHPSTNIPLFITVKLKSRIEGA